MDLYPDRAFPANIAHRGARSLAPENTLQAAELGRLAGAELWELDVTRAAGGALVVIHDDTLERTSDAPLVYPDRAPWNVHDFTLDELRRLDFGSWFAERDPFGQIAAGAVSPALVESYRGARIPTLHEALLFTRAQRWQVNVEIKDQAGRPGADTIAAEVVQLVEQMAMVDRVLISSFNHAYLRQVRDRHPTLATAALVETPHPDPLGLLAQLNAQAYNPNLDTLDPAQVALLRQAGYAVNVWTANRSADLERLAALGVTGIFTDFPQRLARLAAGQSAG
ncbi:MAG: glycerophosphodiester phosphodiesterase [Chloroflexota bacterium]